MAFGTVIVTQDVGVVGLVVVIKVSRHNGICPTAISRGQTNFMGVTYQHDGTVINSFVLVQLISGIVHRGIYLLVFPGNEI